MAASGEVVVRVRGLTVGFGKQTVLEDVDLELERGEILGVVGGSGAGKSVLLRAIIGLITPWRGTVELFGRALDPEALSGRDEIERRSGVLFQHGALFGALTVAQNVAVPLREHTALSPELVAELCRTKLRLVGLPPDAGDKYPAALSGGMRKRAALARALALDPELLFLDEPTSGLDPIGAAAFDDTLVRLQCALGLSVFMVTHDLDSLRAVCDRIAVIAEKHVIVTGPMEAMLRHEHPWIREYFHGPRARAVPDLHGA